MNVKNENMASVRNKEVVSGEFQLLRDSNIHEFQNRIKQNNWLKRLSYVCWLDYVRLSIWRKAGVLASSQSLLAAYVTMQPHKIPHANKRSRNLLTLMCCNIPLCDRFHFDNALKHPSFGQRSVSQLNLQQDFTRINEFSCLSLCTVSAVLPTVLL